MEVLIVVFAVCLLIGFIGVPALIRLRKQRGDLRTRQAHWKKFDDTHHWDVSADEWVRNDRQRTD